MTISDSSNPATPHASIEDLDAAICRLSRDINVAQYRLLLLIREFDDRFGWAKWSFRSCSEWLAWRSGITLSAAREKVRTAQALRGLPQISEAFADGRVIPNCGYDTEDARPDPVDLEDTSAEVWLARLVKRAKPSAEVRDFVPRYVIRRAGVGCMSGRDGPFV